LDEFPKSLTIETGTPVSDVALTGDPEYQYKITTDRGAVRARHVVHATNAFANQFVPALKGKMTSVLCHMTSQRPGRNFPDLDGRRSWSIFYGDPGFDYITQRPTRDGIQGDVLLGGGAMRSRDQGMDMFGVYDDSRVDPLTASHLFGSMPTIFEPHWGHPAESDTTPSTVWSGVIAVPSDLRPLVGRLDPTLTGRIPRHQVVKKDHGQPEPGEWISAGYFGDGMVWAWLSGTALGLMISGSELDDLPAEPGRPSGQLYDWFPKDLLPTIQRVRKMDLTDLMDDLN
jgi:glycine/D-amino acid oxidase-like deaminating enzyme